MNKQIPSINKIIEYGELRRNWNHYEDKIKNAKATFTTRQPSHKSTVNLMNNKTARQPFGNNFSRIMDIQLENKALLKKLTKNGQNNKKSSLNSAGQDFSNLRVARNSRIIPKLTKNNRKKYYEQYQRRLQNQGLLKRMKQSKTSYGMLKYVAQRKKTERYINSIAKFGYKDLKPNKTILRFQGNANRNKNKTQIQNSQFYEKDIKYGNIQQEFEKENIRYTHSRFGPQRLGQKKLKDLNLNLTNQAFGPKYQQNLQEETRREKIMRLSQRNESNSRQGSRSQNNSANKTFPHIITEQEIKLKGRFFLLKGTEHRNTISLEIVNKKIQSMGGDYIHEVEISQKVFKRRFGSRIDFLINCLKYDPKNQLFYLVENQSQRKH